MTRSLLHVATDWPGHYPQVATTIAKQAPEQIDGALWAAGHGGQQATAELLLAHGADLNRPAPWDGLTPLDAARRNNFHDVADWLATQGARTTVEWPTRPK